MSEFRVLTSAIAKQAVEKGALLRRSEGQSSSTYINTPAVTGLLAPCSALFLNGLGLPASKIVVTGVLHSFERRGLFPGLKKGAHYFVALGFGVKG